MLSLSLSVSVFPCRCFCLRRSLRLCLCLCFVAPRCLCPHPPPVDCVCLSPSSCLSLFRPVYLCLSAPPRYLFRYVYLSLCVALIIRSSVQLSLKALSVSTRIYLSASVYPSPFVCTSLLGYLSVHTSIFLSVSHRSFIFQYAFACRPALCACVWLYSSVPVSPSPVSWRLSVCLSINLHGLILHKQPCLSPRICLCCLNLPMRTSAL